MRGYKYGNKRQPPLIEPADQQRHLLSFYNLAEAQVLAATRERDIPLKKVRRAVEYLRTELHDDRPLLTHVFHRYGRDLFVRHLATGRLRQPLNVSRYGQYGIRQVLRRYLQRIERDPQGRPLIVFPLRPGQRDRRKRIAINPLVSSGRPSLYGSGIMAEVIWHRKKSGEKVAELARDYRLKRSDIKAAIRYFEPAA